MHTFENGRGLAWLERVCGERVRGQGFMAWLQLFKSLDFNRGKRNSQGMTGAGVSVLGGREFSGGRTFRAKMGTIPAKPGWWVTSE